MIHWEKRGYKIKITFLNNKFYLDNSGILIWPKYEIAIVSDLHLEKASSYAKSGQFVPPYDSEETLSKLFLKLEKYKSKKLILLGDTFHDKDAQHRLSDTSKNLFKKLVINYKTILITGNHDPDLNIDKVERFIEYKIDHINFIHKAIKNKNSQISGHFHPSISLKITEKQIRGKCLIHNENIMILPAFGSLTGGLDIKHKEFQTYFGNKFIIYLISKKRILKFSSRNISLN